MTRDPYVRQHRSRRRSGSLVAGALLVSGALAWSAPGIGFAAQSGTAGPNNDITDVPGITVGHETNDSAHTGTTVVFARNSGTGGVDVRGGAPITRETDLLKPTNEVQKLNAVMLTGGGEYGLAAGPGVMQWLHENNIGFQVGLTNPDEVVPIVPGAAINDLRPGRDRKVRPDSGYGYKAVQAAASGPIAQGNVGAGAGAVAGGLKGGVGSASVEMAPGIYVGALVVVDSVGTPADLTSRCALLGAQYALADEFPAYRTPPGGCQTYRVPSPAAGAATTRGAVIGVVATNVTLDKAMNQKVAEIAHDGVLRALGTSHGMSQGDTFFSISTDLVNPAVGVLPACIQSQIRNTALGCQLFYQLLLGKFPDVVSRAVTRAMLSAKTVPGLARSYCDTFAGACGPATAAAAAGVAGGAGGVVAKGAFAAAPLPDALATSRASAARRHDALVLPAAIGALLASGYVRRRRRNWLRMRAFGSSPAAAASS
jgi:L-aminopeptidase/D-esterase-like protein